MKKTQKYRFWLQKGVKDKIWKLKNIFRPQVVYWNILYFFEKPHSCRYFLKFGFFGEDLCIKWSETQKYRFWLQKGVKNKIWKIQNFSRPQIVYWNILYFCEKPHSFRYFLDFRLFGKDLCIKWPKNTKIPFLVTKRSQKQNLKIKKYFSTPSCVLKYFVLLWKTS